eukprot:11877304-Alexandrium_andersonii.AAC.1
MSSGRRIVLRAGGSPPVATGLADGAGGGGSPAAKGDRVGSGGCAGGGPASSIGPAGAPDGT